MIASKTKQKLLDEIQKFGNVYLSCLKVGIDKATYYRWKQKDAKFNEKADEAVQIGRENISDISEHALLQNIKEKNQRAIEYALNHNSERYRERPPSNVIIYHKKEPPIIAEGPKTIEDLLDDNNQRVNDYSLKIYDEFTKSICGIPTKPNGAPISLDEIMGYEFYIRDWQKKRLEEMKKNEPPN